MKAGARFPTAKGRGLEDDICRNVIKWTYSGMTTAELDELLTTMVGHDKFMANRDLYIDEKKTNPAKRLYSEKVEATMEQHNNVTVRQALAHIWGAKQWGAFFHKEVPESRIKKHMINGELIVGISKEPSLGWQPGVAIVERSGSMGSK